MSALRIVVASLVLAACQPAAPRIDPDDYEVVRVCASGLEVVRMDGEVGTIRHWLAEGDEFVPLAVRPEDFCS